MKLVTTLGLALLVTIGSIGALAENRWQGDSQRRESGDRGDRPGRSGVIREGIPPGNVEFKPRVDSHDRDHSRRRDGDHDHNRFTHRPRVIIGVPVIVNPGYYNYPPVYVEPAPRYIEPIDGYWYYCPDFGYYPDVQVCPNEWLKVVPNSP